MSDSIRIRHMAVGDLPAVMTIETEANPVPWSEAMFREALRCGDADVWVAEVDGELIGYAVAWFVADLAELGNIAVAASWRRCGAGTRLIEAVLDCAGERGMGQILLAMRSSNTAAKQFYERFGFREVCRLHKEAYLYEDAIVMSTTVAPPLSRAEALRIIEAYREAREGISE